MSNESMYKVKIEGDGLAFEREISKEIAEKILILIFSGSNLVFPTPKPAEVFPIATAEDTGEAHDNNSDLSVREFLDEHNAKRNPDIITAAALFLSTYESKQYFTREDILIAIEAAAEPSPKNFSRDLKWAIKIGWVAEKRGTKDTYYVTSTGKSAVNTSFPKELLKKTTDPFTGKKASSKKKQENEA
jgi:hypothetical protein